MIVFSSPPGAFEDTALDERNARTVLVVDDDEAVRRTVVRALETEGLVVYEAGNAFEARKAHERAGTVDLVIMDLVLPGLEGRETANLLVAHQPGVEILYTSGYTSLESLRSGPRPANESFLRKPFDVRELIEAVRTALDE